MINQAIIEDAANQIAASHETVKRLAQAVRKEEMSDELLDAVNASEAASLDIEAQLQNIRTEIEHPTG